MSFRVPANQTVCYSVYLQTVSRKFPHDFIKSREARIGRAFDCGEPIWMIEAELDAYFEYWQIPKEKTPLQLAIRVVRTAS
jgi:hypothetical protein